MTDKYSIIRSYEQNDKIYCIQIIILYSFDSGDDGLGTYYYYNTIPVKWYMLICNIRQWVLGVPILNNFSILFAYIFRHSLQ